MARFFVRKPVVIEATLWERQGDHEQVVPFEMAQIRERRGVPERRGRCKYCGSDMAVHGWVETLEGGHIVCPGDWVIKGVKGEFYACKPDVFAETYEEVSGKDVAAGD